MHSRRSKKNYNLFYKKNIPFWILGFLAFLWVLIRSGTNPKRLTYPCQQASLPLASSWLITIIGILGGFVVLKRLMRFSIIASLVILLGVISISSINQNRKSIIPKLPTWQVTNPTSSIIVIDSIPGTTGSLASGDESVPDHYLSDPAMDSLAILLDNLGIPLYKTTANPNGLIGGNDIVIIKGNFQWDFRLGTNTDRIKGLIWLLLNHPDNFTGEILICDNTQKDGDINQLKNNSEDTEQSIIDVVNTFIAKGYPVYLEKWKDYRSIEVSEYKSGDYTNGYIYDEKTKISYPKFQTPSGKYVSLRHGIWNPENSSYNSSSLSIINFPVLKAHGMVGATIAVKNWVGVLTTANEVDRYGGVYNMHYDYFWSDHALAARVMALTYPKLNIIDATWTAAYLNYEQSPEYTYKTGKLIASTDPIAASWYAAKYILHPLAVKPHHVNPDDPNSRYGSALRKWNNFLTDSAGMQCTMDSTKISVYDNSSFDAVAYLEVSPNSDSVSSASGTLSFSVSSNVEWSVTDDVSWLTATKTDGTTMSISYTTNTSTEPRTARIAVEGGGGVSAIVTVIQAGEAAYLDISPDSDSVSSASGTIRINVSSNVEWSVTDDVSWLTAIKSDGTTISISYTTNTSTEPRTARIIVEGTGGVSETVTITQVGEAAYLDISPDSVSVSSASGATSFGISANVEWSVSESSEWLFTTKSSDILLTVYYNENTSVEDRSAILFFSGPGVYSRTARIVQKGMYSTAIVDSFDDKRIKFYPNPTKNILTIETYELGKYYFEITSLNGQIITQKTVFESKHIIDLSNLSEGVYFLSIKSKDFITTEKIIKL